MRCVCRCTISTSHCINVSFTINLELIGIENPGATQHHRHKKKHLHKYGYGEADAHPIEWAHFEPPDSFVQEGLRGLRAFELCSSIVIFYDKTNSMWQLVWFVDAKKKII